MKKGDKLAIIIILIIVLISSISVYLYKKNIKTSHCIAIIKQNGKIIKKIDLNNVQKPYKFKINYKNNEYNIISVEKGRIRFVKADCHNQLCIKSGWLSEPGQNAACLPHKLLIVIEGKNSNIDFVP